jgi:hypothetical protein
MKFAPQQTCWRYASLDKGGFDGYSNDPKIADLHPHREKGRLRL